MYKDLTDCEKQQLKKELQEKVDKILRDTLDEMAQYIITERGATESEAKWKAFQLMLCGITPDSEEFHKAVEEMITLSDIFEPFIKENTKEDWIFMGLDLTIYELKNYDTTKEQKKHEIEEVLYLSNDIAMLMVNWLYRNDDGKLSGNYLNYHDIYHQIGGYKLIDLYKNLKKVIQADTMRDVYALFYFPCLYTVDDWVSSVEMFSEAYYADLEFLYETLDEFLFGENKPSPNNRMFFYNISWWNRMLNRFSYFTDNDTNECLIYDTAHELPKITLKNHKEAKELTYFLNNMQKHNKNLENLLENDKEITKQIQINREVMHQELIEILIIESEKYKNKQNTHPIQGIGADMIAPQVLNHLAHDLGLLKWNEDLDTYKLQNSFGGGIR